MMGRRLDSAEGLKHTSFDAMQCAKMTENTSVVMTKD